MKHEREIIYWAKHPDGTEVWAKSRGITFCKTGFPAWTPEDVYIVDNEWADLRMKGCLGFTIEETLDNGKTWDECPNDWWENDFYNLDFFHVTPEMFRVKKKNVEVCDDERLLQNAIKAGMVICWVANASAIFNKVAVIKDFVQESKSEYVYIDSLGNAWKRAKPVTTEDLCDDFK